MKKQQVIQKGLKPNYELQEIYELDLNKQKGRIID